MLKIIPYWKETLPEDPTFNSPIAGQTFDCAIIGGGIVGLSTAHFLGQHGVRTVVLDKNHIGGTAAISGGILSTDNEKDLSQWFKRLGSGLTRELLGYTKSGAEQLIEIIEKDGWDKPEANGVIVVARNKHSLDLLANDISAHKKMDLPVTELSAADLRGRLGTVSFGGGYYFPDVQAINPYRALRGLAFHLGQKGHILREKINVKEIDANRGQIKTDQGILRADRIVIASGWQIGHFLQPKKPALPLTAFLTVTNPLGQEEKNKILWKNREVIWDIGIVFSYFRFLPDGRILYGPGSVEKFGFIPAAEKERVHLAVAQKAEKELRQIFDLPLQVEYVWSGNIHVTESGLPDFGRVNERISYGAGAGLALGFWMGQQIASLVLDGKTKDDYPLFRQRRFWGLTTVFFHLPLPEKLKLFLANKLMLYLS